MGNEFFWFYDILAAAIVAVYIFRGVKKGAVGVLIGALAAAIALIIATIGSDQLTEIIFKNYVEKSLSEYITTQLEPVMDTGLTAELSKADMSKAIVKDVYLTDMELKFDEKGLAVLDLSNLDLSRTGLTDADLTFFGIPADTDLSNIKLGNISVERKDYNKYGIGNIVLAHFLAAKIESGDIISAFRNISEKIISVLPLTGESMTEDRSGSDSTMYSLLLPIICFSNGSFSEMIIENVIKPAVTAPIKAILFIVIFALVMLILGIIANVSKLMNKIPVISSFNSVLGALLGLMEAVIVIMIICVVIKALISLCGEDLVFLNSSTIDKTFIFKHFYSIDPLRLINNYRI